MAEQGVLHGIVLEPAHLAERQRLQPFMSALGAHGSTLRIPATLSNSLSKITISSTFMCSISAA